MLTPEFLKLSSKLGKNHMLVQGAGGNTSIKRNDKMWIKASGTWLSKSNEENIAQIDSFEEAQGILIEREN